MLIQGSISTGHHRHWRKVCFLYQLWYRHSKTFVLARFYPDHCQLTQASVEGWGMFLACFLYTNLWQLHRWFANRQLSLARQQRQEMHHLQWFRRWRKVACFAVFCTWPSGSFLIPNLDSKSWKLDKCSFFLPMADISLFINLLISMTSVSNFYLI